MCTLRRNSKYLASIYDGNNFLDKKDSFYQNIIFINTENRKSIITKLIDNLITK